MSWTPSPRARVDPRTSRAVPGAHSRVGTVPSRLGFLADAVRFADPPPASALPSLTASCLREPSPPSPRSLYVRGIILGYKRYVDGPPAEPLPRVARRAHRERTKTRLVLRETRAAAATGTTDATLETRGRRRVDTRSPERESRSRGTRAVASTRRGGGALPTVRPAQVGVA